MTKNESNAAQAAATNVDDEPDEWCAFLPSEKIHLPRFLKASSSGLMSSATIQGQAHLQHRLCRYGERDLIIDTLPGGSRP